MKQGFLRFCDDPEPACCRAEKELFMLRDENAQLKQQLAQESETADESCEVDPYLARAEEAEQALDELVKLQSHYAKLLNMYDGGERKGFSSGKEWIMRLRELNIAAE